MIGPFHCIADLRGALMESPVWDERRAKLFACDINGRKLYEIDLEHGPVRDWTFEAEVPCVGLAESGKLIVALAREIILFDPDSGDRQPLWSGYNEPQTSRLNDGKIGPDGALWIGSMDCRPTREPIAKLYRVTADGQAAVMAKGFEVSNGLAWTPDATTMFHTDSGDHGSTVTTLTARRAVLATRDAFATSTKLPADRTAAHAMPKALTGVRVCQLVS
ncbi:SMP-30/gluconolactonase/LRE family protein [Ochrobactrum sp. SSR]|nr:SMP-30/gluconolactonase/LRE family protein [Ochrobactrum sp. SSR]